MTLTEVLLMSDLDAVTFQTVNELLPGDAQPTVTFAGKALDLNAKVGIKYIVDLQAYTGDLSTLTLHVRYTDATGTIRTAIVSRMEAYGKDELYAFTFDGLMAAELRTVVEATVYSGSTPLSHTLRYSPDTYGNHKTGQLLTLCKALFAYSDSAKAYFAS